MSAAETSPVPGVQLVTGYVYKGTTYATEAEAIGHAIWDVIGNAGVAAKVREHKAALVPMLSRLIELER